MIFSEGSEHVLFDILTGKLSIEAAVRRTEDNNLNYIDRKVAPPNSSELLMAECLIQLLKKASEQYDLTLIDAPPSLAVTDAVFVDKQADTTLMVCAIKIKASKRLSDLLNNCSGLGCRRKGLHLMQCSRRALRTLAMNTTNMITHQDFKEIPFRSLELVMGQESQDYAP